MPRAFCYDMEVLAAPKIYLLVRKRDDTFLI